MKPAVWWRWYVAIVMLWGFAIITAVHRAGNTQAIDRFGWRMADHVGSAWSTPLSALAWFGSPVGSALCWAGLAAALLARGRTPQVVWLAGGAAALLLVELALRVQIGSIAVGDLPSVISSPDGHGVGISTYPSGHVARLAFTLVCLIAIVPRRWRMGAACGTLLAVGTVMLERVVANAHTPTDTLGGLLLGLAASFSWWAIVTRLDATPRRADVATQP